MIGVASLLHAKATEPPLIYGFTYILFSFSIAPYTHCVSNYQNSAIECNGKFLTWSL